MLSLDSLLGLVFIFSNYYHDLFPYLVRIRSLVLV